MFKRPTERVLCSDTYLLPDGETEIQMQNNGTGWFLYSRLRGNTHWMPNIDSVRYCLQSESDIHRYAEAKGAKTIAR